MKKIIFGIVSFLFSFPIFSLAHTVEEGNYNNMMDGWGFGGMMGGWWQSWIWMSFCWITAILFIALLVIVIIKLIKK